MLWKLFQIAVFFGVFALLHENGHTKDMGLAPVVVSGVAALLATVVLSAVFGLLRRGYALLFRGHQCVDERRLPRV